MKKNNPLFGIGISALFVILGIYLVLEKANAKDITNPLLLRIVGISCILFFGTLLVLTILKLVKK
jgi:hypothetical protein